MKLIFAPTFIQNETKNININSEASLILYK